MSGGGFLQNYEPVEDRLRAFWEDWKDGAITTRLLSPVDASFYIVEARVWKRRFLPSASQETSWTQPPDATGLAKEADAQRGVNATSALENCETSAIGRALANLGYAAKGKRPSREEMSKASARTRAPEARSQEVHRAGDGGQADGEPEAFGEGVNGSPTREGSDGEGAAPAVEPGEGSSGPSHTSDGPPSDGAPSPAPVASDDTATLRGTEGGESVTPPAGPALLSSQAKQLLRHAADLRWTDADISAAVAEAYPGLGAIGELDQEQARALIPEWSRLVKATRITSEQRARLKPLATNADVVRQAQVMFGADHVRNVSDLTNSEADAVIAALEQTREGAA